MTARFRRIRFDTESAHVGKGARRRGARPDAGNPRSMLERRVEGHATTIHPAFFYEIRADTTCLKRLLAQLEILVSMRPFGLDHFASLAQVLGACRDQLAFQFLLEEAYGYFDDAIAEALHLSAKAATLLDEHVPLFDEICDLATRAVEVVEKNPRLRVVAALRRDAREFARCLRAHERLENQMIQEACSVDLGVGD